MRINDGGNLDDESKVSEDRKYLSLSTLLSTAGLSLDFTKIGESTYFKAKEAFDIYIKSSSELLESSKMLSSVIEQTLNLLAFRYDIDEEIQA